jgi:hypothetical protein
MSEKHVFEVELRVKAHGQDDAVVSREYVSADKASTDGAAGEIWAGVSDTLKSNMRPVADGR